MKGTVKIMVQQDRSLIKWILLTLVTCGFYGLYFLYKLVKDVNVICNGDGEQTPGLAAYFFLSLVTCGIYAYYWFYKLGDRLQKNAPRYNMTINESGSTILLFLLINLITGGVGTILATYYIIKNVNALATAYNQWISGGNAYTTVNG